MRSLLLEAVNHHVAPASILSYRFFGFSFNLTFVLSSSSSPLPGSSPFSRFTSFLRLIPLYLSLLSLPFGSIPSCSIPGTVPRLSTP